MNGKIQTRTMKTGNIIWYYDDSGASGHLINTAGDGVGHSIAAAEAILGPVALIAMVKDVPHLERYPDQIIGFVETDMNL
jgi:hypothetical protein